MESREEEHTEHFNAFSSELYELRKKECRIAYEAAVAAGLDVNLLDDVKHLFNDTSSDIFIEIEEKKLIHKNKGETKVSDAESDDDPMDIEKKITKFKELLQAILYLANIYMQGTYIHKQEKIGCHLYEKVIELFNIHNSSLNLSTSEKEFDLNPEKKKIHIHIGEARLALGHYYEFCIGSNSDNKLSKDDRRNMVLSYYQRGAVHNHPLAAYRSQNLTLNFDNYKLTEHILEIESNDQNEHIELENISNNKQALNNVLDIAELINQYSKVYNFYKRTKSRENSGLLYLLGWLTEWSHKNMSSEKNYIFTSLYNSNNYFSKPYVNTDYHFYYSLFKQGHLAVAAFFRLLPFDIETNSININKEMPDEQTSFNLLVNNANSNQPRVEISCYLSLHYFNIGDYDESIKYLYKTASVYDYSTAESLKQPDSAISYPPLIFIIELLLRVVNIYQFNENNLLIIGHLAKIKELINKLPKDDILTISGRQTFAGLFYYREVYKHEIMFIEMKLKDNNYNQIDHKHLLELFQKLWEVTSDLVLDEQEYIIKRLKNHLELAKECSQQIKTDINSLINQFEATYLYNRAKKIFRKLDAKFFSKRVNLNGDNLIKFNNMIHDYHSSSIKGFYPASLAIINLYNYKILKAHDEDNVYMIAELCQFIIKDSIKTGRNIQNESHFDKENLGAFKVAQEQLLFLAKNDRGLDTKKNDIEPISIRYQLLREMIVQFFQGYPPTYPENARDQLNNLKLNSLIISKVDNKINENNKRKLKFLTNKSIIDKANKEIIKEKESAKKNILTYVEKTVNELLNIINIPVKRNSKNSQKMTSDEMKLSWFLNQLLMIFQISSYKWVILVNQSAMTALKNLTAPLQTSKTIYDVNNTGEGTSTQQSPSFLIPTLINKVLKHIKDFQEEPEKEMKKEIDEFTMINDETNDIEEETVETNTKEKYPVLTISKSTK